MCRHGFAQRGQTVASLKNTHDAPIGMGVGESDLLLSDPFEIPGLETQIGERIQSMGVKIFARRLSRDIT